MLCSSSNIIITKIRLVRDYLDTIDKKGPIHTICDSILHYPTIPILSLLLPQFDLTALYYDNVGSMIALTSLFETWLQIELMDYGCLMQ